jgi:purine-binding chemotaxis protein CheW
MIRKAQQDPSKNLVGFVVGEVRYAVPIGDVREIVNPLPVVDLPGATTAVVGVADYRDEVVPVVDMRRRFGLHSTPLTRRTKWIVLGVSDRLVALVVDAVTDVFRSEAALRPPPAVTVGTDRRAIAGVTTRDGELVFVLDTARFDDIAIMEEA